MESKPVQHMETTYSQQYNSFTKSYSSVPHTHTVTRYEMQNACRNHVAPSDEATSRVEGKLFVLPDDRARDEVPAR
jgi:hypothetical protein